MSHKMVEPAQGCGTEPENMVQNMKSPIRPNINNCPNIPRPGPKRSHTRTKGEEVVIRAPPSNGKLVTGICHTYVTQRVRGCGARAMSTLAILKYVYAECYQTKDMPSN